MSPKSFDSQPFYPGLRALVYTRFTKTFETITLSTSDFEERSITSLSGKVYKLNDILVFEPPIDYCPCVNCNKKHHPKQNLLDCHR